MTARQEDQWSPTEGTDPEMFSDDCRRGIGIAQVLAGAMRAGDPAGTPAPDDEDIGVVSETLFCQPALSH